LRLERYAQKTGIELSDHHIQLPQRFDPELRELHIKANFEGQLVAIDKFMVGNLNGIGKVYLQTVVDCYSRYAWGHLFRSKISVTAVHVLNERILPFFEERGAHIQTILSDNGREYRERPDHNPFELFLQLEEIEHRATQVRRCRT
jgi:transposase InsO family protein